MDPLTLLGARAGMVIAAMYLLQIIKGQLAKKAIKFKDEDNWTWVALLVGAVLAVIDTAIQAGGFAAFVWLAFVQNCFLFAASCAYVYKVYKITSGGKFEPSNEDTQQPPQTGG